MQNPTPKSWNDVSFNEAALQRFMTAAEERQADWRELVVECAEYGLQNLAPVPKPKIAFRGVQKHTRQKARRANLKQHERDAIIARANRGEKYIDIAKDYDCADSTVAGIMQKWRIEQRAIAAHSAGNGTTPLTPVS